jgi:soluble lytic murein transglycosylase-like protein
VSAIAAPAGRTTFIVRADPHTGRLVRSAVVRSEPVRNSATRATTALKPSKEISDIVDRASRTHQVDPLLVHSIIKVESNYNSYAISNKGAEGLMQLMPPTARMLGVSNSFDPQQNIEAGVKYLKYLQGVYKDDRLALAAYNAGPAAVEKYKQVPPYKETQNYVDQVGKRYEDARRAAGSSSNSSPEKDPAQQAASVKPAVEAALPEPVIVEKHPKLEQSIDANGRLSLRTVE